MPKPHPPDPRTPRRLAPPLPLPEPLSRVLPSNSPSLEQQPLPLGVLGAAPPSSDAHADAEADADADDEGDGDDDLVDADDDGGMSDGWGDEDDE